MDQHQYFETVVEDIEVAGDIEVVGIGEAPSSTCSVGIAEAVVVDAEAFAAVVVVALPFEHWLGELRCWTS